MNFISLGKINLLQNFNIVEQELNNLDIHTKFHGENKILSDRTIWLKYSKKTFSEGDIYFTQNTTKNFILKSFLEPFYIKISSMFNNNHLININYFHFIKTNLNVTRHKDEFRKCCINIGIKNSEISKIRIAKSENVDNESFETNHDVKILNTGEICLLNTSVLHDVISNNPSDRYLLTYGFNLDFNEVKKLII